MNEFISISSFLTPVHVDESAWLRHVPFAFWLVEKLQPGIVVELGVHRGVSYFSFCQGIKENNINCTCYGVDTWKGDHHAGLYDDQVFSDVNNYNKANYAGFSYLLRMSFDEALYSFTDGTIDLLHIDGYHTYEAVKHDFERWLPKLSRRGIILFHDIKVRERGFGVFKLWEELKQQFPHFEFSFGFGLGVLAVGSAYAQELTRLFSADNADTAHKIQQVYNQLGTAVENQYRIMALEQANGGYHNQLLQEQYQNSLQEQEKSALSQSNKHLEVIVREQEIQLKELSSYRAQLRASEEELAAAKKEMSTMQSSATELSNTVGWYQRTYEQRSLPGLLKQRFSRAKHKARQSVIGTLLGSSFIKKRYIVVFLLEYIQENGLRSFLSASLQKINNKGLSVMMHPRETVLQAMSNRFKQNRVKESSPLIKPVDVQALAKEIADFHYQPKISIILTTYNTRPILLVKAIESIRQQIYPNWELCIADDGSSKNNVRQTLAPYLQQQNIKSIFLDSNKGISAASNAAMDLSTGEFIALMDHDDEITKDALFWIVKELNTNSKTDIIYTDECKIDEEGNLSDYFFKPDWSPELMFNMMYTGHLTVYRKQFLAESVGNFRSAFDFSQDYDLMLRASEKAATITHIPRVLYYWRLTQGSASQGEKPYARETNLAALRAALTRRNIEGNVIELPVANRVKISHQSSLVSIVIPTDSQKNLTDAITNIRLNTSYQNYEIIAVTNAKLVTEFKENGIDLTRVVFAVYDKPYNFSDKCNVGVSRAKGEIIIIYNDDVQPLQEDWIENMIELLSVDGVGAVSPKLLYEDDTIQYAGMASGVRNLTGTTFHGYRKTAPDYINFVQLVRNVSILSGACFAIRKSVFIEIGGFDAVNTPIAHSDVDISFKLIEKGYRCVYTPYATLRHFGHLSLSGFKKKIKKIEKDKADIYLLKRWPAMVADDPFFTDAMRYNLYHDSPEYFKIHAPAKKLPLSGYKKQDILFISHELTLSGAPMMMLQACRMLLANGYFVTVVCDQDGPVRSRLCEMGITVIIDALVLQQHASFIRFARNFDLVICNTIVTWPVLQQLQGITKTLWWLHEGKATESFINNPAVTELIATTRTISVSDYAYRYIKAFHPQSIKIRNGCPDIALTIPAMKRDKSPGDKIVFSLIGSIEHRKGQDILVEALQYLPSACLKDIEIWIIGRELDPVYAAKLHEKANAYDFVKIQGAYSHEQTITLMNESDVIVCPSRDDPFPVVLIEALCFSKPCIVSTHTGQCEIMEDGTSGFIFENENPRELAEKIAAFTVSRQLIHDMGIKSRALYMRYLTTEQFEQKMLGLIDQTIHISSNDTIEPVEARKAALTL